MIFALRTWSPGKNTIVVLEVKYRSASCAYSESVVQLVELSGQDEHEATVGVTQKTFSVEQQERLLMSSVPTITVDSTERAIFLSVSSALRGVVPVEFLCLRW